MPRIGDPRQTSPLVDLDYAFGAFLRSLRCAPVGLFRVLLAWQARVSERHHLEDLPDYMLRDVGLTREEVDRESHKPFWRA